MSEISVGAWLEAQKQMHEVEKEFKGGWRVKRMEDSLYFLCKEARDKHISWPAIYKICHNNGLTALCSYETLNRAWTREHNLRTEEH